MSDAFISYSRRDQDFVRELVDELVSDGREVWVDWESIPLTADWFEEIKTGIEAADAFLFVISPDSVRSEVCAAEIEHAINMNKRFVPLLHRELVEAHDKAALHPKISSHNWTFMRTGEEFQENLKLLTDALDTDLEHARIHTRILTRALEWDQRGRDTSFVLRGNDLKEALEWLKISEGKEPEVSEVQTEYIQASQVAERWRKRERALFTGIAVGIVVAVISAVIAVFQAVEAQNQRDIAEQRRQEAEEQRAEAVRQRERAQLLSLAANSQVALTNNNTDLSIALALAANGGDDPEQRSGETERALAEASYSAGTVRRFTGHESPVYAVAFSPDAELAASADNSGVLLVWDVQTGEEVQSFVGHTSQINALEFDPTMTYIVSVACGEQETTNSECIRGDVILWDLETGEEVRRFEGHNDEVTTVTFNPSGERLLTGSTDRTMRLWDVETGDQIGIYRRHLGKVVDVAFHPSEENLAVSLAIDTPPTLWDLDTGREVIRYYQHDVMDEPNLDVGSVTFSPDGTKILGSYGIPMRLWDTTTGELIREFLGHGSYVNSVAFSSDGEIALSSAWRENSFRVWDTDSGVELRRFEGHGGVVRAITISNDGRYALSGSDDTTVRVWDLANGAEVLTLPGHTDDIYAAQYSPRFEDGYLIASAGLDEFVRIWDVESAQQVARLDEHADDVWTIAFSPDGSLLVSGSEDRTAIIWDMDTYESIGVLGPHDDWVTTVAVSPDGQTVLTGSNDQKVRLWDIETEISLGEYAGDDGQLRSVVFTPDGTKFLSGADHARLIDIETGDVVQRYPRLITDEETGEIVEEFEGHSSRINSAAFSSDGSLLATGSADATIRLWETETGKLLTVFEGHSGQVRTVMFSADDSKILTSSADATIRLWSVTGLELRIFSGHDTWVNQAAFSPDGRFAVSGSWDDTLKIWHIHSVEQLIEWTNENRYVRGLTCNEAQIYRVELAECQAN